MVSHYRIYSGIFSEIWRGEYTCGERRHSAVVKIVRSSEGHDSFEANTAQREFEALNHFYKLLDGHNDIAVPRPIVLFGEENALAMNAVEGDNLFKAARRIMPWSLYGLRRIGNYFGLLGKWLTTVQIGDPLRGTIQDRSNPGVAEISRLAQLARAGGINNELAQRAINAGKLLSDKWTKSLPVNTHGDFVPWNVLVSDKGVVLMDFTQYHLSDPEEDLSLMYSAIAGLARFYIPRKKLGWLKRRLLVGYGRVPDQVRWLYWRIRSLLYLTSWLRHHHKDTSWRVSRGVNRLRRMYEMDLSEVLQEVEISTS